MRELALIVANPLVFLGLCALVIWLFVRSPLLAWVGKIILLLGWGVATVGATLFVIVVIYLPKGQYGAAIGALIAGSFISIFWIVFGIPELVKTVKSGKGGVALWKS